MAQLASVISANLQEVLPDEPDVEVQCSYLQVSRGLQLQSSLCIIPTAAVSEHVLVPPGPAGDDRDRGHRVGDGSRPQLPADPAEGERPAANPLQSPPKR